MATTTASFRLSSGDLTSDALSLSANQTLFGSAGTTGPTLTSGIVRTKGFGTEAVLIANGTYAGVAYVFIKNTDTTYTNAVHIDIGTTALGNLYGGQFMFVPWDTTIDIDADAVSDDTVIEYIVVYTG